jgi:hypothetical protein
VDARRHHDDRDPRASHDVSPPAKIPRWRPG